MIKRLGNLVLLSLITLPVVVWAEGVFSTTQSMPDIFSKLSTDVSLSFLRLIFGSVSGQLTGAANQLVGEMFRVFNIGVLVITGALISYTVVTTVVNSSKDANQASGNNLNPWVLARVVTGSSLLIPSFSGYSGVQVIVMWAVVQGVGFANTMWGRAVDIVQKQGGVFTSSATILDTSGEDSTLQEDSETNYYNAIETFIKPTNTSSMNDVYLPNIIYSSVCAKLHNLATNTSDYMPRNGAQCADGADNQVICFGSAAYKDICGKYNINSTGTDEYSKALFNASVYNFVLSVFTNISEFIEELNNNIGTPEDAVTLCNGPTCKIGDNIANNTIDLFAQLKTDLMIVPMVSDNQEKLRKRHLENAKKQGWIVAGQVYSALVQSNIASQATTYKEISEMIQVGTNSSSLAYKYRHNGNNAASQIAVKLTPGVYTNISNAILANIQAVARNKVSSLTQSYSAGINIDAELDQVTGVLWYNLLQNPAGLAKSAFSAYSMSMNPINAIDSMNGRGGYAAGKAGVGGSVQRLDFASRNMVTSLLMVMEELTGFKIFYPHITEGNYGSDNPPLNTACTGNYVNSNPQVAILRKKIHDEKERWGFLSNLLGARGWIANDESTLNNLMAANPQSNCSELCAVEGGLGCFSCLKKAGCIISGVGILGSILSEKTRGTPIDPLMTMRNIGKTMMKAAILYWVVTLHQVYRAAIKIALVVAGYLTMVKVLTAAVVGIVGPASQLLGSLAGAIGGIFEFIFKILFDLDKFAMELYLPMGTALATIMFTMGMMLGIYLPFMPFLLFLFASLGWLTSVVEAMIAAPLVALGMTHPEGHDLLGKAEQAVMLLLSVFIRPVTMILGLFFGITILYIGMKLVNFGFLYVIADFFGSASHYVEQTKADTIGRTIKLIGCVAIFFIYTYVCLTVVTQCLSLIYQIPDRIMRWIGGPQDQSQVAKMMQEVKEGVSQASDTAAGGASQTTQKGAPAVQPTAINLGDGGGGGDDDKSKDGDGDGDKSSKVSSEGAPPAAPPAEAPPIPP